MKDETVWLSLEQMSKLFGRDRTVITRHINNVFKDNELDYYNLDMIINIGYRVKSKNIIIFRKWANKVLKKPHKWS